MFTKRAIQQTFDNKLAEAQILLSTNVISKRGKSYCARAKVATPKLCKACIDELISANHAALMNTIAKSHLCHI